jgi:hypothetical protein
MSEAFVTVSRLTVQCTVPRDHPHTERVRWRIGEAAGAPLRQALEDVLWPLSAAHTDEVVIIRRMELSFDLDTSRDLSDVARHWAARLSAALVRVLDGSRATGMLRFESRAHFLARFLVDAAAGRAASKWYYRQFRGLEALAIPAVLRTALLEDVERGIAALRTLEPHELVPVLHALGALEARRVIEAVRSHDGDSSRIESAVEALIAVAPGWRAIAPALDSPWTAALALLVLASDPPIAPLPAVATLAASVAAWLHEQPGFAPELVPPELASLAALSEAKRAAVAAAFKKSDATTAIVDESVSAYTRFGGLILLLPHVAELPIDAMFGSGDRPWVRLMVLARCAGADGAARALADPVLARLCGVSGKEAPFHDWIEDARDRLAAFERAFDPTDGDLSWFGAELALAAHHVLRRFARRLPGFSESSPRFLYENFLAFPATVEHADEAIVCRMGRPPLAALLGITGALRGRIRVPWLPPVDLHSLS